MIHNFKSFFMMLFFIGILFTMAFSVLASCEGIPALPIGDLTNISLDGITNQTQNGTDSMFFTIIGFNSSDSWLFPPEIKGNNYLSNDAYVDDLENTTLNFSYFNWGAHDIPSYPFVIDADDYVTLYYDGLSINVTLYESSSGQVEGFIGNDGFMYASLIWCSENNSFHVKIPKSNTSYTGGHFIPPVSVPPLSEVFNLILSGGSLSQVLFVYNPVLYNSTSVCWVDIFSGNYISSFFPDLGACVLLSIQYISREPVSLFPVAYQSEVD